jgi:TolB protein
MKNTILLTFAVAGFGLTAFPADQRIAFERNDAVYIANLDGTGEKKIGDGIFPAISPDGTHVAFNTVEKTSDTTYVRHIAVVNVATGKLNVFKDVPSDNSYYPSWTTDGKQILFTTRPHEVWDLVAINSDGTNFHVLKPGVQNEVTRYSPIWARDGQSVFCEDMSNVYQLGLDGAVRAQWKIGKIMPKGDMSGDGRIDVSPDGKRLLLSIDMGEESGAKIGTARCRRCGRSISNRKRRRGSRRRNFSDGMASGSTITTSSFSAKRPAKRIIRFIECPLTGKI